MKVVQLVLPVTGHRLGRLAAIKENYNHSAPLRDSVSLGFIGSCGFLALLGWLLFGKRENNTVLPLDALSVLNACAVLLGTVGGFGSLFALLISPRFRSLYRISIYIGFLAIFAVILLLERLRQAWARQTWTAHTRDTVLFHLLVASLLVLGVFDQTTPDFVPRYSELRAEYESDADFVRRIEAALPQNAMVFQLPYVPFPENPPVNRMRDYDHLRGYLHSRSLRWSYGAMKGGEGDLWEKNIAVKPIDELVESLASAGFSGIYVDRFGYADQSAKLEMELAKTLDTRPIISANQRLSFFDFARVKAKLHENTRLPPH